MKKYLLIIEDKDEKEWVKFSKAYNPELGKNINEAIIRLIKKYNIGDFE
jgi:hypothetical protein